MSARGASRVAYAAAAANALAGAATLVLLRPGLPGTGAGLAERLEYVRSHPAPWRAGWAAWHLAALTLLALFVVLWRRWRDRAPVAATLALLLAAAGLAVDLAAQAILVAVAPRADVSVYPVLERAALVLTGYVANGAYTAAGILLTWAGRHDLPRPLLALAAAVWAAGIALAAASLAGWGTGQVAAASALVPLFVVWALLVGRWLSR